MRNGVKKLVAGVAGLLASGVYAQNVGVGTTTPQAKLHIQGASGGTQIFRVDTSGALIPYFIIDQWGGIGIHVGTPEALLHVSGTRWMATDSLILWVQDLDTVPDSSGVITRKGFLGLGTLAPQVRIHVSRGDVHVEGNVSLDPCAGVYSVSGTNFQWTSFSGTTVFLGDDQVSSAIPLPFPFTFFCQTYNSIYISSNGFITFLPGQPSGCCSGQCIPSGATPNGLVAGYWEDLNPGAGGSIKYGVVGNPPNRIFIVEFSNVPHFGGGNNVSFQIKLFEADHSIEIHCLNCPSDGGSHTQGIEAPAGNTAYALPGRVCANFSLFNDAVRFVPVIGDSVSTTVFYVDYDSGRVGIGTDSPTNILTVVPRSISDPIADAWLVYSTPETKEIIIGTADHKVFQYLEIFRNLPVYEWKRTKEEPIRLSILATPETPSFLLGYDEHGNIQGVDLYGYVGFLHEVMKAQLNLIDSLKIKVQELDNRVKELENAPDCPASPR